MPNSLLAMSVQRVGELDMMLRCMEDDFRSTPEGTGEAAIFAGHYQIMLSELWVGAVYEIFRLLKERNLVSGDEFSVLAHDLRLLRIPLEKHEIAADRKLIEPLLMRRIPSGDDATEPYLYLKGDVQRAHIMPSVISNRGSVMWQVIDVETKNSYWLERRSLSERIIALWEVDPTVPPASAQR